MFPGCPEHCNAIPRISRAGWAISLEKSMKPHFLNF